MIMKFTYNLFLIIFIIPFCKFYSTSLNFRPQVHRTKDVSLDSKRIFTKKLHRFKESVAEITENDSFPHFLAGMVAGAMECLVGHPLETLRVMTMTQTNGRLSTWNLFLQSVSEKGSFLDLYRGSVSELIGSALTSSYVYGANDFLKRLIGKSIEDDDFEKVDLKLLVSASATGILDVLISKPLEMIKLRQQAAMDSTLIHASFGARAKELLLENGFFGLYRGWLPTVLREALGSLAYFATYQHVKNLLIDGIDRSHQGVRSRQQNGQGSKTSFKSNRNNDRRDTDNNRSQDKINVTQERMPMLRPRLSVLRPVGNNGEKGVGRPSGESTRDRFLGVFESNLVVLIAGGAAGLLYVAITHPLDVLSVAMQIDLPTVVSSAASVTVTSAAQNTLRPTVPSTIARLLAPWRGAAGQNLVSLQHSYKYRNVLQCARDVVRQQGLVNGLFKGFGPALVRSVPCYSVSLWSYEMTLALCARFKPSTTSV